MARCEPAATVTIDSRSGEQRTAHSSASFVIRESDYGDKDSIRLLLSAPGFAVQSRFLNKSILKTSEADVFELSETRLYPEQISLEFEAYPPDATLSLEGVSGDGMEPQFLGSHPRIEVAQKYDLTQGKFLEMNLLISRPGYRSWRKRTALNTLAKPGQEVADLGKIELVPLSGLGDRWQQFLVFHRFHTGLAIGIDVLLLGFLATIPFHFLPKRRARLREKELWEKKARLESLIDGTDPLLKKVLGEYYVTARIGKGGMSKVYRALPNSTLDLEDAVAVKVIDEDLARSAEFRARFMREIEVCASLNHPNVVKLVDWGTAGELLYMVQELVTGDTLQDIVKEPLSEERFLQLFIPILSGLGAAHDKAIIHRDLKPANIMLNDKGQVKIMDFGLAKADKTGHDLTKTGDAFGTPIYMSPEQISGGGVEPAADLYSLGVMAFELLTGRLPYEAGEDPMSVMLAHLQQEPIRLRSVRPEISAAIDEAIATMLKKDPKERYAHPREVIEALRKS